MAYFVDKENNIKQFDQSMYDIWLETGNPKSEYFTPIPDPPENATWNGIEWVVSKIVSFEPKSTKNFISPMDNVFVEASKNKI